MLTRRAVLGSLTIAPAAPAAVWACPANESLDLPAVKFGWIRDQVEPSEIRTLESGGQPKSAVDVDLRPLFPEPFDQGLIQSCVANAVASLVQYVRERDNQKPAFVPSRLFFYYYGRYLSQSRDPDKYSVYYDEGMSYIDALTTIRAFGICPELLWTYDDTPPDASTRLFAPSAKAATQPPDDAYIQARKHVAIGSGTTILKGNLQTLHSALMAKTPFLLGFDVSRSFFDEVGRPKSEVPLPSASERSDGALFGHGVLVVGYKTTEKQFICRNSWGPARQDKGYFYLPADYVLDPDLVGAIWTIGKVHSVLM